MIRPLAPMLPTLVNEWPVGEDWIYEVKYDGYRGQLIIEEEQVRLYSRNLNLLNDTFPEIIASLDESTVSLDAPCILDGEICTLESKTKANFSWLQKRGRLKNKDKINQAIRKHPATFVAFDILMHQGRNLCRIPLKERKSILNHFITHPVDSNSQDAVQKVISEIEPEMLWEKIRKNKGEGLVAKKLSSQWIAKQRTEHWLKVKNYQKGIFFITAFDKKNGYFHVSLIKEQHITKVGLFSHGLSDEARATLIQVIKANKDEESSNLITIHPSICVELDYLEWYEKELRQPRFVRFRLDWNWEDCTWDQMKHNK